MEGKDLFSNQSEAYASFRPVYPEDLYHFIFKYVEARESAWDCATGNGQVARRLATDFTSVHGTDISQSQLAKAYAAPNIFYSVAPAEKTLFNDSVFDLITVGQALHWFDHSRFYDEVRRVGKQNSIIAAWGYGHILINPGIDAFIHEFYTAVVGPYWDDARRHVETSYENIPFPFQSIKTPQFFITTEWSVDHLLGYLESWSSTQAYIKANKINPVTSLAPEFKEVWGSSGRYRVRFPLFVKLGRVH